MKRWIILAAFLAASLPGSGASLDFSDASRIVIQSGGRKKPLDTFASESLQALSGRRTYLDRSTGQRLTAMDTLFSIWFGTRDWQKMPVILVPNAALRQQLGLPSGERFFSFEALMSSHALTEGYASIEAKQKRREELTPAEKQIEVIAGRIETLSQLASSDAVRIVPHPDDAKGSWTSPAASAAPWGTERSQKITAALARVAQSYRSNDENGFASSARELQSALSSLAPAIYPSRGSIERELRYNHLHAFRLSWILYLGAFIFLLVPAGPLNKARTSWAGVLLFGAGIALHTYGFILRCQIAGYAPVTNMYESVVWVSLGVAALSFGFALKYRARIYLLTAAPVAVAGLILADMLPSVLNPSIGPLPPVLRDNFWLATHVLTITLGYAAFALAMALGHFVLGCYLFKRRTISEKSSYHYLLHRVLQIGVFLLAIGTILGGVWANYAWGRFWGWDPKETWALIALLLYILALHGRLAGWWGNFGLSVAAVVCFNGVLMAWYGVNFVLGKGLHSYGFGGGGLSWIGSLVALDLAFVAYCAAQRARTLSRRVPAVEALASQA